MSRKEYAVYAGEEFLDLGTAAELAAKFQVSRETIVFWSTPTNHKRAEKKDGEMGNRKIAIRIEEEAE